MGYSIVTRPHSKRCWNRISPNHCPQEASGFHRNIQAAWTGILGYISWMPSLFCSLVICSSGVLGPLDSKTTLWVPKTQQAFGWPKHVHCVTKIPRDPTLGPRFFGVFLRRWIQINDVCIEATEENNNNTDPWFRGLIHEPKSTFPPQNEWSEPKKITQLRRKIMLANIVKPPFLEFHLHFSRVYPPKSNARDRKPPIRMVPRLGLDLGDFCFGVHASKGDLGSPQDLL